MWWCTQTIKCISIQTCWNSWGSNLHCPPIPPTITWSRWAHSRHVIWDVFAKSGQFLKTYSTRKIYIDTCPSGNKQYICRMGAHALITSYVYLHIESNNSEGLDIVSKLDAWETGEAQENQRGLHDIHAGVLIKMMKLLNLCESAPVLFRHKR